MCNIFTLLFKILLTVIADNCFSNFLAIFLMEMVLDTIMDINLILDQLGQYGFGTCFKIR